MKGVYSGKNGKMIFLSNKDMKIGISKRRGNLEEIYLNRNEFGKWNGCPAYTVIEDELKGKSYKDTEDILSLSIKKYRDNGKAVIESLKEFKGADFLIKEVRTMERDSFSWRVEVVLKKEKRERSVRVKQFIPYPKNPYGLGIWAAHSQFPTRIERVGGLHLAYGDVCFGTVIPAISLYKEKEDVGLTIAKPFGLKTAKLAFIISDYRSFGIEVETSLLALRREKPAKVEIMLHAHQGCWRPGLDWLQKKYPQYFSPPNKKVREMEGGYLMAHPFISEEEVKSVVPSGVKSEQISWHYPYMGQFAPKEKEWKNMLCLVSVPEDPGLKAATGVISPEVINKHLDMVHRNKIKSLLYFQCAGDGYIPYVTKNFPDSIVKDASGSPISSWIECYMMNSDPKTSFGKEMLRMIDRLFNVYPDVDGVFLDQLCYDAVDIAHDDGITMFKNKPAYLLWHCYEKPVKKLAHIVHKQGKVILSNAPYNIEVQKDIDGHMAEGPSYIAHVVKYICLSKPLLFLPYYTTAKGAEEMFRQCLLCGASSYAVYPHLSKEVKRIMDAYIPLVGKLRGRKWLLEPHPAKFPEGCDGNIFWDEDGKVIITIVNTGRSVLDENGVERDVKVCVSFKDMAEFACGYSLGTHYPGRKSIEVKRNRKGLEIRVAEHSAASVIVLEKGGNP